METLAFSIFFLIFFTPTMSKTICNPSSCLPTGPSIRFPFQLETHQPDECGSRGFSLFCNNNNQTTLNLPSGDVIIKSINYPQQIAKIDPQFCLPNRINSFTLTGTPFDNNFQPDYYRFFNCSPSIHIIRVSNIVPFDCLSGPDYNVFALPIAYANQVPNNGSCQIISTIPIPGLFHSFVDSKQDVEIYWNYPNCRGCEEFKHGTCLAKPNHPDETVCRSSSISLSGSAKYGLIISLGLSVILGVIGLV